MIRIKSSKDFFSGLLFSAVGGFFAWRAFEYRIGDASQMEPGYFPLMLGVVLACVGLAVLVRSLTVRAEGGEPIGTIAWRPVFFVVVANMAFGVLVGGSPGIGLPPLGLMTAIVSVTMIASCAGTEFRLREALILGLVLAGTSYVVFIRLLDLPIPAWPAFLSR